MSPASESPVFTLGYTVQLPWTLLTKCQGSTASTDQPNLINGSHVACRHSEWAVSSNLLRALALGHLVTTVPFPKSVKLGTFLNSQLWEASQPLFLPCRSHLSLHLIPTFTITKGKEVMEGTPDLSIWAGKKRFLASPSLLCLLV